MNPHVSPHQEQEVKIRLNVDTEAAFSALYDRYAAVLLGVIIKIVSDKAEAVALLEVAFSRIRLQGDKFQSGNQPLFLGLLQIARSTALDALKERQRVNGNTLQLTETGKVIVSGWQQPVSTDSSDSRPTNVITPKLNELLDSVLFKNCTPEEAASSLGIPVELVRQQLRLALQQLRMPKA